MRNIQNINIRYGSGVPVPCDPRDRYEVNHLYTIKKWHVQLECIQIAEPITPTAHLMNSSPTRSINIFKTETNQGSVTCPVPVHPDG